jgi:hypothetical protein
MKAIKRNMKDQILTKDRKILYCKICGSEYSGNAGDYWHLPDNHVFKCCNEPMELVTKVVKVRYI